MAWKYFDVFKDGMACPCGCGFGSNPAEFNHYLVTQLDLLREMWSAPIRLTSAARCEKHNEAIGGEKNSAHLPDADSQCRAVDIAAPFGSFDRKRFILMANRCGFQRIGIGKTFVHVDVAAEHGSPGLPEGWFVYQDARG